MEGLDAPGGEGQRLALRGRHLGRGRLALGVGNAQVRAASVSTLSNFRVYSSTAASPRARTSATMSAAIAIDVLVGVPIAPEEGRKVLFEIRRRGVEPERL